MESVESTARLSAAVQETRGSGLLLAFSNPPLGDEEAFNAWYEVHAAARLTVPGIYSARRYQAITDDGPRYMACYDLESIETLHSPEYRHVQTEAVPSDREMMPRLPLLERRVLKLLHGTDPWTADPPYVLSLAYEPAADVTIEAVLEWYREEHTRMLLEIDGWRRVRMFERIEGPGPRIVALHELESPGVFDTEGYRKATSTPWRERIVGTASSRERFLFRHLRTFSPVRP
jgi:hypothetical protein